MNILSPSYFLLLTFILCLTSPEVSAQQADSSILTILRQKVDGFLECHEHDSVYHYAEQARLFAMENNYPVQQLEFTVKQRLALFRVFPNQVHVPFTLFSEALPVAQHLLESGDSSLWIANLYGGMAQIYQYKRDYHQTQLFLDRGLTAIPISHQQLSVIKGRLLVAKGLLFYVRFESSDSISSYLNLAKKELQDDPAGLMSWHVLAGKLALRKNNYLLAEEHALHQLTYAELTNNFDFIDLLVYNDLSRICLLRGDYDRAVGYLQLAKTGIRKSNQMGNILSQLGDYEEALEYLMESEKLIHRGGGYFRNYLSNTYRIMGDVYIGLKAYQKAESSYHRSIQTENKLTTIDSVLYHDAMSDLYFTQGRYADALIQLQLMQKFKQYLASNTDVAIVLHHKLGETHLALNQARRALFYHQKARILLLADSIDSGFSAVSIHRLNNPYHYFVNLYSLAETYAQHYPITNNVAYLDSAYQLFQTADEIVDTLRIQFHGEASKRLLSRSGFDLYFKAILLCRQLWKLTGEYSYLEKAFYYIERSKSYRLHQAVRESEARKFLHVPDSLLKLENELIHQIQVLEKKNFALREQEKKDFALRAQKKKGWERTNPNKLARSRENLGKEIFQTKGAYKDLIHRFEQDYPAYYQQKYQSAVLPLADLQRTSQQSNRALIEYVFEKNTLLTFVITPDTTMFEEVPLSFSLDSAIQHLREHIFSYGMNPQYPSSAPSKQHQGYTELAYRLYQLLLEPFMNHLKGINGLTIVPDGPLGYLPFEALLTSLPESAGRFGNHPYLLHEFPISYSFSSTIQAWKTSQQIHHSSPHVLAIRPEFPSNDQMYADLQTLRRDGFGPLRFSKSEVNGISQQFTTTILADSLAIKDRVQKALEDDQYSIIHLATHAKSHDHQPRKAKIAFSPVNDTLMEQDFLTYEEIFNLNLHADMVVLSACETGLGELQKGEGIMSLARAFTYAGAQSVVTTLWSVDDRSTSVLMQSFYQALKEGMSKDQAMQLAKLAYINNHDNQFAHPFFWAGPVIIGNPDPVRQKGIPSAVFWIGLTALLVMMIGIVARNIQRKTQA
ncbi:MAG: CHAT domain-containing tetratricopeptide repeat protein [Bacteroidota bacterium]